MAAAIAAIAAVASMTVVGLASPAMAEPNPCSGVSGDKGTGGDLPTSDGLNHVVYGNWWNCSGGTGADRVRLNVTAGLDGNCITVPYGSSRYSETNTIVPGRYGGWARC